MSTRKSMAIWLLLVLVLIWLSHGCISMVSADRLSGTIIRQTSGETGPLVKMLSQGFMLKYPAVLIVDYKNEVGDPIETCTGGVIDVGAISYQLTDPGRKRVLSEYLFARDGVAIIVHPTQPVDRLTTAQVTDIFSGNITNWSAVGGKDEEIHVFVRDEPTIDEMSKPNRISSPNTMQSLVLKNNILPMKAAPRSTDEGMRFTVAHDPQSIGFISFGSLRDSVKALVINDVPATVLNIKNQTYPLTIPMYFITRGPAKEPYKSFIDFCLGDEGQAIVRQEGYFLIK